MKKKKKMQLPDSPPSIITDNVIHHVNLLQKNPNLDALWNIRYFSQEGKQGTYYISCNIAGTTYNESLHSSLSAAKPAKSSRMSLSYLEMMLGIFVLNYNFRYNIV